jgi:hypothetical protein
MKSATLACLALAAGMAAVPARPAPFDDAARVDDATLDKLRGGVRLPDGTDVTVGVAIETRVNGELVLRTALNSEALGAQVTSAPGFGGVRVETTPGGQMVTLVGPSLELRHLVGEATGAVVANTANNRVIDTLTVVNVELRDAGALVAPTMFQIEAIALDAATRGQF